MDSSKPHVVVIGAGVMGLTNALFLSDAGYTVTVIAAHVPGDESIEYTSPWAGAHWRTHATSEQREQCDWDVQTFKWWEDLVSKEGEGKRAGIKMVPSLHYWDGDVTENLWWAPHIRSFEQTSALHPPILSINQNRPSHAPEIKWGATSEAFSIDAPHYIRYLQSRIEQSGVIVFQSRLPTDGGFTKALETAEGICRVIGRGKVDCFINSTGLGSFTLCNDSKVFPIRGQTVLVKGEATATRTRYHSGAIGAGDTSYCIVRPGSGTTILGGTKEVGVWDPAPSEATAKKILERCAWMVPELLTSGDGGFEVISTQCGLRPGREGGPRVERERVEGRWSVVHAYGHAGGGYQNSVGTARKVLRLVGESIGRAAGSEGEDRARL